MVNIDQAGKIRSQAVVIPIIIRKPTISLSHNHQITSPFVVDVVGFLLLTIQHQFHTRRFLEHGSHLRQHGWVVQINVGNLMVGHGKGSRRTGVK